MKNETVEILREQIAELRQLLALKDQRINELLCRPSYPQITYPQYPNYPQYPYGTWISTSNPVIPTVTTGQHTIGYNQPINHHKN